ncbi:putative TonB-dependent receptor [Candidatus Zixiibacteriota bacterium]|nr:putative TonB-dependent receptor [candidate division Zixibacteria bacterium]
MNRKIFASVFLIVLALAFVLPQYIFAGTVGKISGKVINEETKEPLPGVAVSLVGTKMGALTNEEGEYYILNVPAGNYTIQAQLIGFAPVQVTNTQVTPDLTTYTDFSLSKKALELGKTIVVRAERPLVIKDKTTSVAITSGAELQQMPVRGYDQVVGLQNSVVRMNSNVDIRQRGARESLASAPEINLRGGRPSEVAYYVDGFSQQDPLTGISTASIANNAVEEVSVTSGAFDAEYGNVASGIVNVITNSGTDKYHAKAELASDNIANPFGYDSFDQNWYSADVSGPIPGMKKAYFFLSGERRWFGDRTPSKITKDLYQEFGVDKFYNLKEPQRLPNNTLDGYSFQGKLDFDLTQNIKLALMGNGSRDRWQEYRHYYMNPRFTDEIKHLPRYDDKNLGLNAKITHTLSPQTFYNLSASYFMTERTRGDGVWFDNTARYKRALTNPRYDTYNLFRQGDSVFASDLNPSIPKGSEADTFVTFYESYWNNFMHRKSSYIGFKGDITSQIGRSHTVKAGFEYQRHTLRYYENFDATLQQLLYTNVNNYGFDSLGNETDALDFKSSTKHPINLGLYVQDRFEWSSFILKAGLRFDLFDYKALRLRDVNRPFDPDNTGSSTLDRSDLTSTRKFYRASPRLGISFPVSDKTQFYFNYGQYYQRPDLTNLYASYNFLAARITAGSYYPFPSPDLGPEKTTQYEFGLTHQLGDMVAMGVAAYYKDVEDLTQIFHQNAIPRAFDYYANTDYGTIKGVDFNLTMKRTHNIALDLKYSLSYANGTGSYSQSAFNIAWKNPQGGFAKQTAPLDYDQRHSIIGIIDIRTGKGEGPLLGNIRILENTGLNAVIQAASGLPYTPMQIYDGVSPNAAVQQIPTGPINSANMPWTFNIDIKLERTFYYKNYRFVPYIWVRNLLNRENVVGVYEGTGKANTSGYLESAEGQTRDIASGGEFGYRYRFEENDPKNYLNPRMIICGLRMAF